MAGEPPRPLDQVGLEDAKPTIEWKETWPATYEANRKRWAEELKATKDGRLRDQFLSLRLVGLLEQLAQRFPGDAARRMAAYGEMADQFAAGGFRDRANRCLRRLVEECPGAVEPVAAALHRILTTTQSQRREVEGGEAWVAYAVERLLALNQAGQLADGHPSVELAWKTVLEGAMEGGRFWEAAQALERLVHR